MKLSRAWRLPAVVGLGLLVASCDTQPDDSLTFSEAEQELLVCQDDQVVPGIDVSYYQGDIDWDQVAGAGFGFAITRINHSDFMDPKFDTNWARIKEVGMVRGAYQYFEPAEDVTWQAQVVIDKLGKLGPGDLPAVIDVEENGGLPPAQVAQAVSEWILLVEAGTGKKPMIYAGKYFWQDNVQSAAFADHALWHAQYPTACQPPAAPPPTCGCPNIADQWSDWVVWQYSSSGSVPGIAGNVDMNVFNGSSQQLINYAAAGGSYGASVEQIEAPKTVLTGEVFEVTLHLRNTGGVAFGTNTFLGTTEPRDRMSVFQDASWASPNRAASFAGVVEPGELGIVTFTMSAPQQPGSFLEHFGLVEEGVAWFGDQGGPADGALALSLQVIAGPSSGSAGGGLPDGDDDDGDGAADDDASCDCQLAGGSGAPNGSTLAGLALLLSLGWRRMRLVRRG